MSYQPGLPGAINLVVNGNRTRMRAAAVHGLSGKWVYGREVEDVRKVFGGSLFLRAEKRVMEAAANVRAEQN